MNMEQSKLVNTNQRSKECVANRIEYIYQLRRTTGKNILNFFEKFRVGFNLSFAIRQ